MSANYSLVGSDKRVRPEMRKGKEGTINGPSPQFSKTSDIKPGAKANAGRNCCVGYHKAD